MNKKILAIIDEYIDANFENKHCYQNSKRVVISTDNLIGNINHRMIETRNLSYKYDKLQSDYMLSDVTTYINDDSTYESLSFHYDEKLTIESEISKAKQNIKKQALSVLLSFINSSGNSTEFSKLEIVLAHDNMKDRLIFITKNVMFSKDYQSDYKYMTTTLFNLYQDEIIDTVTAAKLMYVQD